MSKCLGCFFHESGYMWNRCNLLETECYAEPDDCTGFSINPVSKEEAEKLYERFVTTYNDSATDINAATKNGKIIYLQDALDALDEIESEVAEGYGFQYEKWRKYFTDLPSARSDHIADDSKKGDSISRKMAIDAINTWDKFGVDERGRLVRWHEGLMLYVRLRDVLTAIVNLPSAQIDWGKPVGDGRPLADSEVIPRLQTIKAQIGGSYAIERAIDVLEQLPSAQPEIVRCKDCKHKPSGDGVNHRITFPDERCPCQCDDYWYSWLPDDDWFCGNAERREE